MNVTTAMLGTHTEEPHVALASQGCWPRNHAASQPWFNIPKSALTGFIPQRGGWEGWEGEGLCHPEPPSEEMPISILVSTLDFSGDLEGEEPWGSGNRESSAGIPWQQSLAAFSLLYKALCGRAASPAKAPGGFVPRWPLHPCSHIPAFQAGPGTHSPDFSKEHPQG